MGAYNVAVVLPDDATDIELAVSEAMEPYRGAEWEWYTIGAYRWPGIYATVDADGRWVVGPPPDGIAFVVLRCKG
ncbi:hypothetical protein [Mycobacteroides abscessus]|uniref:hypothetical protein n=1 Tax=Mycobacteroides abscessus TaxID=36809 RepID=UPI0005DD4FC0|nr:hypothetical protein [Mycobacteroides abscessus]CPR78971.1 Uncharacterised protein [Mycobacteroides abscessus]CPR88136.1 Uncharacterised protein [Mycobacteroides abscessus]CPS43127.1 Uncharacterised protein [Mycobacteroides abscessus]CPV02896.1 Uncharacterised protein [Mycobacteroides abscessus]